MTHTAGDAAEQFTVFLRQLAAEDFVPLKVSPSMNVVQVKRLVHNQLGVAPCLQKILCGDSLLDDFSCLEDYAITEGTELMLVKSGKTFDTGEEVEAKDSEGSWWPAVVNKQNGDGSYHLTVKISNGPTWPDVLPINMRHHQDFHVGETLEGKDCSDVWWPVVIKTKNDNNTYAVDVLDSEERHWPQTWKRYLREVEDFQVGQILEGKAANEAWWPVRVTSKNADGTYAVEVFDNHGTCWPNAGRSNLR